MIVKEILNKYVTLKNYDKSRGLENVEAGLNAVRGLRCIATHFISTVQKSLVLLSFYCPHIQDITLHSFILKHQPNISKSRRTEYPIFLEKLGSWKL